MSYNPTSWRTGDIITAESMNKIENGIVNSAAVIITDTNGTLNKTFKEIYELIQQGFLCCIKLVQGNDDITAYYTDQLLVPIQRIVKYDTMYRIYAALPSPYSNVTESNVGVPGVITYSVSGINDYPTFYRQTRATESGLDILNYIA